MQVSVIVPYTPQSNRISQVLKALELQSGLSFEVLGVFNPHTASMPEIPKVSYPYMQLTSARGANTARNVGLKKAKSDIAVFLDADCIPTHPHFLLNYYNSLQSNPELTGVGGFYRLTTESSVEEKAYHHLQSLWIQEGIMSPQGDCRNLLGGNLALRVSNLQGHFFDENLLFGGTERELLQRLQREGHKFRLISDQEVWHSSQLNRISLMQKAWAQGQGARYIQEKWGIEKKSVLNLRTTSASEEISNSLHLYNISFELGFRKSISYQVKKIWKSRLSDLFEIFSIARHAQSIKDRKES